MLATDRRTQVESQEETARKAEALKAIYRKDGTDLADDEAVALAKHLGNRPFWSAVLCVVLFLGLIAFLVVRFLL